MTTPLNPALFKRLREEFGQVQTANPGVGASFTHTIDPSTLRTKMNVNSSGEYYKVCCPTCMDSRYRLWISHLWGVHDDVTNTHNLWLAICYNEDCLSSFERRYELFDRVYGYKNVNLRGQPVIIHQGEVEEDTKLKEVKLPGLVLPVDKFQQTDPVHRYLVSRRHQPVQLVKDFDISYCLDAHPEYRMANGRLVIPIKMNNTLVGWQCRYPGDVDWKQARIPKYYNKPGMAKRLMLYNYDTAIKSPYVILCEGPTDVWNVGSSGVAMFGKKPSNQQLQLIASGWEEGAVAVMLDGEAWEESQSVITRLKESNYRGQVVAVKLPHGKDPGDFANDYLIDRVMNEFEKAGIDVNTLRKGQHYDIDGGRLSYRAPGSDVKRRPT